MTPAQSQPSDSEQNKTSKIKVVITNQADESVTPTNQLHHKRTKPWVNLSGIDLPGLAIRTRQWMPFESNADTSMKAAEKDNHNDENEDEDSRPGTSTEIYGSSGGGRLFSERGRAAKVNQSFTP